MKKTQQIFILIIFILFMQTNVDASVVKVIHDRTQKRYFLTVDGSEFFIRGVGVDRARDEETGTDYLALAKEMGANCVRTWGEKQIEPDYLDKAHRLGLKVDVGIWMNYPVPGKISYQDFNYRSQRKTEILGFIRKYKAHPAVLMWNVGNEVFSSTQDKNEKEAFAKFLEEICEQIHIEDPDHPVIYAEANGKALKYIDESIPALDIVGFNSYNSVSMMQDQWMRAELGIPYVITEYGPPGFWEVSKDSHGRALEISDMKKAWYYEKGAKLAIKNKQHCLGAFAFKLGLSPQTSSSWFSLTYRGYKSASFLTLQNIFLGKDVKSAIWAVKKMILPTKSLKASERFNVSLDVDGVEAQNLRYEFRIGSADEEGIYVNKDSALPFRRLSGSNPVFSLQAPKEAGIYRVYVYARDKRGVASALSGTIQVV